MYHRRRLLLVHFRLQPTHDTGNAIDTHSRAVRYFLGRTGDTQHHRDAALTAQRRQVRRAAAQLGDDRIDAFAAADPALRSALLDSIGLSATTDGPLVVTYELLSDGTTISQATIERPATGERVSYELAELHQQPPVIELLSE